MAINTADLKEKFDVESLFDKSRINSEGQRFIEIDPKTKLNISNLWSIAIRGINPSTPVCTLIKEGKQTDNLKYTILTSLSWPIFFRHAFVAARDCYDIYAPEVDVVVTAIQKLKTDADNFFKEVGKILGCSFALKVRDFSNENINEETRKSAPHQKTMSVYTFSDKLAGLSKCFDTIKTDLFGLQSSLSQTEKEDLITFITENVKDSIEYFFEITEEHFKAMTPLTIKAEVEPNPPAPSFTPMADTLSRTSDVIGDQEKSPKTTIKKNN